MRWDSFLQGPLWFFDNALVSLTEIATGSRALQRIHLQLLFLLTYTFVLFRPKALFLLIARMKELSLTCCCLNIMLWMLILIFSINLALRGRVNYLGNYYLWLTEVNVLILIKHGLELQKTPASINLLFRGTTLQVADCVAIHVVIVIHSSFLTTVHKSFNTCYLVYKYWISGHCFDTLSLKREILRKRLRWRRLYLNILVVAFLE